MRKSTPIRYLIEFGRATVPGQPHVIVYIPGSPKAKRKTLCGIPRSELQIAAPYPLWHRRSDLQWQQLCSECSQRFDAMA